MGRIVRVIVRVVIVVNLKWCGVREFASWLFMARCPSRRFMLMGLIVVIAFRRLDRGIGTSGETPHV